MEKFKQGATIFTMIAIGIYMLIAAVGSAAETVKNFGDSITQTDGEGVRCYTYRQSISCVPDLFPKSSVIQ